MSPPYSPRGKNNIVLMTYPRDRIILIRLTFPGALLPEDVLSETDRIPRRHSASFRRPWPRFPNGEYDTGSVASAQQHCNDAAQREVLISRLGQIKRLAACEDVFHCFRLGE